MLGEARDGRARVERGELAAGGSGGVVRRGGGVGGELGIAVLERVPVQRLCDGRRARDAPRGVSIGRRAERRSEVLRDELLVGREAHRRDRVRRVPAHGDDIDSLERLRGDDEPPVVELVVRAHARERARRRRTRAWLEAVRGAVEVVATAR